jgi:hypothetical protein
VKSNGDGWGVVTDGTTAEEIEGGKLMVMTARRLPYPLVDADKYLYEPEDALTKSLPPEYDGVRNHAGGHLALLMKLDDGAN